MPAPAQTTRGNIRPPRPPSDAGSPISRYDAGPEVEASPLKAHAHGREGLSGRLLNGVEGAGRHHGNNGGRNACQQKRFHNRSPKFVSIIARCAGARESGLLSSLIIWCAETGFLNRRKPLCRSSHQTRGKGKCKMAEGEELGSNSSNALHSLGWTPVTRRIGSGDPINRRRRHANWLPVRNARGPL